MLTSGPGLPRRSDCTESGKEPCRPLQYWAVELSIDQLNARFGGGGNSGDINALLAGAVETGDPISAQVARSMACCLAMSTSAHWRRFEIVGSLRREQAWVGDLDLLVQGDLAPMSKIFQSMGLTHGVGGGGGRLTIHAGQFQIDFWTALDEDWGASQLSLSGPTGYVIGLCQVGPAGHGAEPARPVPRPRAHRGPDRAGNLPGARQAVEATPAERRLAAR